MLNKRKISKIAKYIKTYGADKFREVINGSKTPFEYSLDNVLSRYDINLAQDKIKALKELTNIISEVYSAAERNVYINIVSKKLSVPVSAIEADINKSFSKKVSGAKKDEGRKIQQRSLGYSDRINPDFIKAPALAKKEENLLALLILYPNHRRKVLENNLVSEDDFFTELNKRIFSYIKDTSDGSYHNIGDFNQAFSADEVGRITAMKLSRMNLSENGDQVLTESINSLKRSMEKKMSTSTNTYEGLNDLLNKKRSN